MDHEAKGLWSWFDTSNKPRFGVVGEVRCDGSTGMWCDSFEGAIQNQTRLIGIAPNELINTSNILLVVPLEMM